MLTHQSINPSIRLQFGSGYAGLRILRFNPFPVLARKLKVSACWGAQPNLRSLGEHLARGSAGPKEPARLPPWLITAFSLGCLLLDEASRLP